MTFVLPSYPHRPVGGFRVVYEYANHLVARGHEVSVVHVRRCAVPRSARLERISHLKDAIRPPIRFARDLLTKPAVDWHDIDPRVQVLYVPTLDARHVPTGDVIVATAWRTARSVWEYGSDKGVKFYLIQHHETWDGSVAAVNDTWRLPMRKVVIARWLERTGRNLAVPAHHMRYIPNGIDQKTYKVVRPLSERPRRVAALCHPSDWKGGRDAVAALKSVRMSVPDVEAVMFGTMERPAWVPRWIEYRRNPPQVELVEQVYNGSSIYMCASWTEGWHLPNTEAMACGCAVVSTDIDGVADYAFDGKTALLGRPREPATLARRVVELLRNDFLRLSIAEAGLDLIGSFTWSSSTDALERWFQEATEDEVGASGTRRHD